MNMQEPTFENLSEHCLFCDPGRHGQANQILLRSDNFYLFAGLGAIVDGYVIIAPYRCGDADLPMRSFSECPGELLDEAAFLRGLLASFYREEFNDAGMSFEHGRAGGCLASFSHTRHCHHAHLCCFPVSQPLWEADETKAIWHKMEGQLHGLAAGVGRSAYLYVERVVVDEQQQICHAKRETWDARALIVDSEIVLESQRLRKLLAKLLNRPDSWDWRAFPTVDSARASAERFRKWLAAADRYDVCWEDDVPRLDFLKSVNKSNAIGNNSVAGRFWKKWSGDLQYGAIGRFLRRLPDWEEHRRGAGAEQQQVNRRPVVLDAGCGVGTYANSFYHLGIECRAIDISDEMLIHARELAGQQQAQMGNVPPVEFSKQDAFNPDFPVQTFNGIWYSAVFVHLPRRQAPITLSVLHRMLKPNGVLYISIQLGAGIVVRWEGRVFFYYTDLEVRRLFREAGFDVAETWQAKVHKGSCGDNREKKWAHYLLTPSQPRQAVTPMSADHSLLELGERGILKHLSSKFASDHHTQIVLGFGDDGAAVRAEADEVVVASTDPCPTPVIELLGDSDPYYRGWFSVIISVSDLGAMGARPLGILLAIEAPESMLLSELDAFYAGVLDAADEFDCPVLGGNLKDAERLNCVTTALGAVRPEQMLRRDAARPDEKILVLGDLGRFWAGVLHRSENIPLGQKEQDWALGSLRRPVPRIREGVALASQNLARCAMDSSDGLTACFHEIADSSSDVDLHIDLTHVEPPPIVQQVARAAGIEVNKLLLGWGDWQLVTTVAAGDLDASRGLMKDLNCPVWEIGWVSPGKGEVWLHGSDGTSPLTRFASERFTATSYFSHGLSSYIEALRRTSLFRYDPAQDR